ncbi:hypothetical protein GALMADRAFT_144269 [Galerina marginata CBS 339.88]|uniref:Uncharacterized protein n=1 Tax=Galerina marginata (strain CBS 339.88) TaxID=685588 RepID=A0A067SSV0_GALM3|nr:hypothetical protein GALMADRAFT_144269 [Galerina marginata CBS 339.88]
MSTKDGRDDMYWLSHRHCNTTFIAAGPLPLTLYISSSLPPPTFFFLHDAPKLEQVILECRIDNFGLSSHVPSPNLDGEQIPFAPSFTALGRLTIPAFWLIDMQLSSPDPEWFSKLNCLKMDVMVTKFEFPQSGQYSLTNFLRCLSELRVPASIFLQDLYLSYEYSVDNLNSADRTHPAYTFSGTDTYFKSVSKDFIAHFYALANVVSGFMLSFEDCEIPNISHLQYARNICLENIVDDQGQSLRNVLAAWEGSCLTTYSCPPFNDTFLSWLRSVQEYIRIDTEGNRVSIKAYPAVNLSSLQIDDCVNFTAPALMEVVKFRSDNHAAYLELGKAGSDKSLNTDSIDSVSVTGRGPPFTLEDMSLHWLYDKIEILTWNTEDDEGGEHWYQQGDEERCFD